MKVTACTGLGWRTLIACPSCPPVSRVTNDNFLVRGSAMDAGWSVTRKTPTDGKT